MQVSQRLIVFFHLVLLQPSLAQDATAQEHPGWSVGGPARSAFIVSPDRNTAHSGSTSARLEAVDFQNGNFVTLMQKVHAERFLGRRIRMTAWVKAESVSGAHLWMRVDGTDRYLAMDAMEGRRLDGSFNWRPVEIVLDVPKNAKLINLGAVLQSKGVLWIDEFSLLEVPHETAATNTLVGTPEFENRTKLRPSESLPRELVNPGFETLHAGALESKSHSGT